MAMTPDPGTATVRVMTIPTVIEKPAQMEAVVPDTFIDGEVSERAASWPWPRRRPADA